MADEERLRRGVLETAQMMVDNPDEVRVEVVGTNERIVLRLHVHHSDVGKVIGRALRTIGGAMAVTMGTRLTIDIAENEKLSA